MTARRIAAVGTALLLVLIGAASGSRAAADPVSDAYDVEARAAAAGKTTAEITAEYGWHDDFNKLATWAAETYPGSYADAKITDSTSATIWFVGEPPEAATERAAKIDGAGVTVEGGAAFSEAKMRETLSATYDKIYGDSRVSEATGSFDAVKGRVLIKYEPSEEGRTLTPSNLTADLERAVASKGKAVTLDLEQTEGLPKLKLTANAYGGSYLDSAAGGLAVCTTSFVVYKTSATSVKGHATANHCAGATSLRNRNHNTSSYVLVSRQGRSSASNIDLAWYSVGSSTPSRYFYFNFGQTRLVTATSNPAVGSAIARFGRVSGYSASGTVYSKDGCYSGTCGLTLVSGLSGATTDSGGPTFWNNTANGVITGTVGSRLAFTPVSFLPTVPYPTDSCETGKPV